MSKNIDSFLPEETMLSDRSRNGEAVGPQEGKRRCPPPPVVLKLLTTWVLSEARELNILRENTSLGNSKTT